MVAMNYWLTTQWPPREGATTDGHSGIYLAEDNERAGLDIRPGDIVFIYESKGGRTEVREDVSGKKHYYKKIEGREGIVSVAEVTSSLMRDDTSEITRYANNTEIRWLWYANTSTLSNQGFVHRKEVNRILGYRENNPMRALGEMHSGLKKLTPLQYKNLLERFNANNLDINKLKQKLSVLGKGFGGGPESEEHRLLKEYVAVNPSVALGEQNLEHVCTEYQFPTQDRADIVLFDLYGKIIGVEVEVSVGKNQFAGLIQAVKYRHMLAVILGYPFEHSRSFLVAYEIDDEVVTYCRQYDIECFIVSMEDVSMWANRTSH